VGMGYKLWRSCCGADSSQPATRMANWGLRMRVSSPKVLVQGDFINRRSIHKFLVHDRRLL
jgi:hypothetical protein